MRRPSAGGFVTSFAEPQVGATRYPYEGPRKSPAGKNKSRLSYENFSERVGRQYWRKFQPDDAVLITEIYQSVPGTRLYNGSVRFEGDTGPQQPFPWQARVRFLSRARLPPCPNQQRHHRSVAATSERQQRVSRGIWRAGMGPCTCLRNR